MALGVSHDRGIDEPQVELPELGINLDGTPYQALGHEVDSMVSLGYRTQKRDPCVAADPRPQQLIDFDDDGVQHDKLSSQLRDQGGREPMGVVPAIRGSDDGSRVGQDSQSLETSSRR